MGKTHLSGVALASFCLISLLVPFYPRTDQNKILAQARRPQVTELDENKIKSLVGIRGGRARPLLLYLWYTACQTCCAKLTDVDTIYAEYHDRGLDVALVSIRPMDNKDSLSAYLEGHNTHAPVYLLDDLDEDLSEQIFLKDWEAVV